LIIFPHPKKPQVVEEYVKEIFLKEEPVVQKNLAFITT